MAEGCTGLGWEAHCVWSFPFLDNYTAVVATGHDDRGAIFAAWVLLPAWPWQCAVRGARCTALVLPPPVHVNVQAPSRRAGSAACGGSRALSHGDTAAAADTHAAFPATPRHARYELSHTLLGVSPWYWWTGVEPAYLGTVAVPLPLRNTIPPPKYKYRALFPTDEDLLSSFGVSSPAGGSAPVP